MPPGEAIRDLRVGADEMREFFRRALKLLDEVETGKRGLEIKVTATFTKKTP